MNPEELVTFITERKWIALAALIIGIVVRLLKSDTKLPIDIPSRYRVWLALGLGGAAGALDKLGNMHGVTWTSALAQGLAAAVLAIVGHETIIESARGGKELPLPGLIKPGVPPGPGKPPTILAIDDTLPLLNTPIIERESDGGPEHRTTFRSWHHARAPLRLTGAFLLLSFGGCALFTADNAPKTILTFEQVACIVANAFLDEPSLAAICNLLTGEQREQAKKLASSTRESVTRELSSRAHVPACVDKDGGR